MYQIRTSWERGQSGPVSKWPTIHSDIPDFSPKRFRASSRIDAHFATKSGDRPASFNPASSLQIEWYACPPAGVRTPSS